MIFNLKNKGRINQRFLDNATDLYASEGLIGHTGVDHSKGYGTPVVTDNACYVYKITRGESNSANWQAVYTIVEDSMEVCFGHLSRIDVKEGQALKAGDQVGLEGNRGDVFSGGIRITPEMQRAGDQRGAHVHESWRPVVMVRAVHEMRGVHYLRLSNGHAFSKAHHLFEISYDNPQTNGTVDPLLYSAEAPGLQIIATLKTVMSMMYALIAKPKK